MRVLVVLPTYNEAANIAEVLSRLRSACPEAHVLVVDDDSPDGTADIVGSIAGDLSGIEVLRRGQKMGLGSAYRTGFAHGLKQGFEIIAEMDSDLSHSPEILPQLIEAIKSGADLAIGSRYIPGGSIPDWSWHRKLLSRLGSRYAASVLGLAVADATSGYRTYRAAALTNIDLQAIRADGYGFQIEMVYRIKSNGGLVVELPITFLDRVKGKSKMSYQIIVEAFVLVTFWGIRDRLHRVLRWFEAKAVQQWRSRPFDQEE